MAFAVFYNQQDLTPIAANLASNPPGLSNADKQLATKIWNGGFKNWQSATVAPAPFNDGTPDNPTLMVVVSATGVTKQNMIDLLNRIGAMGDQFGYLTSIAFDMSLTSVEPWPPA